MLSLFKSVISCEFPSTLLDEHRDVLSYIYNSLNCCRRHHNDLGVTSSYRENLTFQEMSVLFGESYQLPLPHNIVSYLEVSLQDGALSRLHGLHYDNNFITYQELEVKSNALSSFLNSSLLQGIICDELVIAIDIAPSFELLIAIIAVLKLGGAFLPVDSCSAMSRVKKILRDSQPACIIVDCNSAFYSDSNDELWSSYKIFDISKHNLFVQDMNRGSIQMVSSYPDTCCILYTSGSTGTPKCVKITHKALLNRLHFQWKSFPFELNDVGCFKTSILFVDSLVEIFSCILKLVPLVIIPKPVVVDPERLVPMLEHYRVTRLTLVPSLLRNILMYVHDNGADERLPDLKMWICNSEKLTMDLMKQYFDLFPTRLFANFYGSTETMADVTYEIYENMDDLARKQKLGNLSIGRPFINNNIYILDSTGCLLSSGSVGEICVSGFNLTLCTEESAYISNDIIDDPDHRVIYRTGDFGRIIRGMLIYEGRRDTQVKIRGQRVNIAEIEQVIMECDAVKQVVILCHQFSCISTILVAYYVLKPGLNKSLVQHQIIDACRISLPPYMRPKLVNVKEMPLQAHTGKIDRVKLKQFYEHKFKRQSTMELLTFDEKSQKVLNIIGMNLKIPPQAIPQKRSFSELGGDSVSMVSTIVQLKRYGLHIDIESFANASTLQDIINLVKESSDFFPEKPPDRYKVNRLIDVSNPEETMHIMAESFVIKDPLEVLLGITKEEFLPFARSLFEAAMKSDLSIVVIDKFTGKIVAGDFLFSLTKGCDVRHHQSMAPILALLKEFEQPVIKQLTTMKEGELMFNFCLFVHKDLDYSEQVKLCHLIEDTVIHVARSHEFSGIVTNNTNSVTQDICEHFFDYQLLSKQRVSDFVYNGRKVFAHAPKDYHIKLMIKHL